MAQLAWGKPTIKIGKLPASGDYTDITNWIAIPTPVEGTTQMQTTKGDKTEAKIEGGTNEDVKYKKNTYALEFEIYAKKGRTKPIADVDGIIDGEYALKLQPEDASVAGIIIQKAHVSVEDTWNAEDGGKWKYTFDALEPDSGNQILYEVITFD